MRYDSSTALWLRRFGQRLGILRPAVRLYRRLTGSAYEEKFDAALLSEARSGDVVWDVGANVGFYTEKLARIVGPAGRVVAFEPAPGSLARLRQAVAGLAQVTIADVALSDAEGSAEFYSDGDSVTNSLNPDGARGTASLVAVRTGDGYLADFAPNVIKIDVEGFEIDVIAGLTRTLESKGLRAIFIEMHFLELARRGHPRASADICRILEAAGFATRWIDPSHVVARR